MSYSSSCNFIFSLLDHYSHPDLSSMQIGYKQDKGIFIKPAETHHAPHFGSPLQRDSANTVLSQLVILFIQDHVIEINPYL